MKFADVTHSPVDGGFYAEIWDIDEPADVVTVPVTGAFEHREDLVRAISDAGFTDVTVRDI